MYVDVLVAPGGSLYHVFLHYRLPLQLRCVLGGVKISDAKLWI